MLKIAIWILAILSMNTKFQLNDVYIHFEGYVICTMKKVLTSRFWIYYSYLGNHYLKGLSKPHVISYQASTAVTDGKAYADLLEVEQLWT